MTETEELINALREDNKKLLEEETSKFNSLLRDGHLAVIKPNVTRITSSDGAYKLAMNGEVLDGEKSIMYLEFIVHDFSFKDAESKEYIDCKLTVNIHTPEGDEELGKYSKEITAKIPESKFNLAEYAITEMMCIGLSQESGNTTEINTDR